MNNQDLIPFIERFSQARVLCVGDVMLDHFIYGDVNRISPEAPIPVVRVSHERSMLGGAGNVVRNLSALGAQATLITVVGADSAADVIAQELDNLPNCALHAVADTKRQTSVKTRYICGGQQLLRVDRESTQGIDEGILETLLRHFKRALADCGVVILSDYAKGVLAGERAARFIGAARQAGKTVFVDPKGRDFGRYRGASLVKPNLQELSESTGLAVTNDEQVEAAARRLIAEHQIEAVLVTRGAGGMMLVSQAAAPVLLRSVAREIFDVSGAGDTVAAAFAAGVAAGMPMENAMRVANVAAGIVVAKIGTATATQEQLLAELESADALAVETRVVDLEEAAHRCRLWRRLGLRVGVLSAPFNVLDGTALATLQQARQKCDRLIVVSETKPLLLAALVYVDLVIAASHSTEILRKELEPDHLV